MAVPARKRKASWSLVLSALFVFVASLIFFTFKIGEPPKQVFDETYYVPAAKQIVEIKPSQNYEHPPLAKEIIGIAIKAFGDDSIGWRMASAVFGALICVSFFLIAQHFLNSHRMALIVVPLLWVNGMLFVLSRLALLEVFVVGFLSLAWLAFLKDRQRTCGLLLGAAISCKWSAVPYLVFVLALSLWRSPKTWRVTLLSYVAFPIAIYVSSYIPIAMINEPGFSPRALLQMQVAMWQTHQQGIARHKENSGWTDWPLRTRPMWLLKDYYILEKTEDSTIQVVSVWLNPMISMLGIVLGFVGIMKSKRRQAYTQLGVIILLCLGPWMLSGRTNTYYYYYFPAALALTMAASLGLVEIMQGKKVWGKRLGIFCLLLAVGMFVYHLPLLTGEVLPLSKTIEKYPYSLSISMTDSKDM